MKAGLQKKNHNIPSHYILDLMNYLIVPQDKNKLKIFKYITDFSPVFVLKY